MSGVTLRLADHVATVTIDRPDVLNAIDLATDIWIGLAMKRIGRPPASPPSMIMRLCRVCGSTSASRMSRTGADSRSCSSRRASQCSRVSLANRSRKIWCSSALFFTCCS